MAVSDPFYGGPFFSGGFFGELVRAGGTSKRDKRRKNVRRYSDPEPEILEFPSVNLPVFVEEDDDDEILIKVLAITIH